MLVLIVLSTHVVGSESIPNPNPAGQTGSSPSTPMTTPTGKRLLRKTLEQYTYDGKRASEWALELKTTSAEKAKQALTQLGKEAISAVLPLVREAETKLSDLAGEIVIAAGHDKDAILLLISLLKDDNYRVRKTAVLALAPFASSNPTVAIALKEVLKDKDRAVAVAAETLLSNIKPNTASNQSGMNDLLELGEKKLEEGNVEFALALIDEMRRLDPDNYQARRLEATAHAVQVEKVASQKKKRTAALLDEAERKLEAGDYHIAAELAIEAKIVSPEDERVSTMLNKTMDAMANADRKANSVKMLAEAVSSFNQTDYIQAERAAEEALLLDPENSLAQEIHKISEIRAVAVKARLKAESEARAKSKKKVIEQYLELAQSSLGKADFELGLKCAREVLSLDPTNKLAQELLTRSEQLITKAELQRNAENDVRNGRIGTVTKDPDNRIRDDRLKYDEDLQPAIKKQATTEMMDE